MLGKGIGFNLKLKQPKTQEEVDDAFETWLECAKELGILDIYKVISYDCGEENDTVVAISFAVDKEALLRHMQNILQSETKSIDM